MTRNKIEPPTMWILESGYFRWTFMLLTLGLSAVAIFAASTGLFESAGQIAGVASALATILLVSLTAQYASLTQELVEETRRSRKKELEERELERQREVSSLRNALYKEIEKVEYFEDLAENYEVHRSIDRFPAPSIIYETNGGKIGLLTEDEIDFIIEYYTRLNRVEELMELQAKLDTTIGMNPFTELYRRTEAMINIVLREISFGRFGNTGVDNRKERIGDELSKLAVSQKNALEKLEANM